MRRSTQRALGVDLSHTHISLALMARDKDGIRLVRGVRVPLPEGSLVGGRIQDAERLGQLLRRLCVKHRLNAPVAISTLDTTVLSQMLELPKRLPTNIASFVRNELKQCVVVSGETMVSSYGSIGVSPEGHHRLLAVAGDQLQISRLVRICQKSRLAPMTVEPDILAYVRALHASRVAEHQDANVLLIWCRDHALQLCVFRGGRIDLLRTRNIQSLVENPEALCARIATELGAMIQYYDIEAVPQQERWRISVVTDPGIMLPVDALSTLQAQRPEALFELMDESKMASLIANADACASTTSLVAMGLALVRLAPVDCLPKINLLPAHIAQARALQRRTVLATLAALLGGVCIWLVILGMTWHADVTRTRIAGFLHPRDASASEMQAQRQEQLDQRIELLSRIYERTRVLADMHTHVDWSVLIADVYDELDACIQITGFDGSADTAELVLDGAARSISDVRAFADRLCQGERFASILIAEAKQPLNEALRQQDSFPVSYQMRCQLQESIGIKP